MGFFVCWMMGRFKNRKEKRKKKIKMPKMKASMRTKYCSPNQIKMKIILFSLIYFIQFGLITTTLNAQTIENNKALKTKIDTYLNASVRNGFSGAVLVSKKGEIILSKGYGWSDRKNKISNTPSTVFNIGSITKQFTASAILKLVEQGKIKTSDKISLYYNQAPIDKKDITIHHLLTHTSGISPKTGGFRYNEADKEQFLKDFFELELQSKPVTKHQYANANYIMLTAILESVSKQSYGSFLNENLFDPYVNITLGVLYLSWLQGKYNGDTKKMLKAYHEGPGRVDKAGILNYRKDTYVNKVLQLAARN